MPFAIIILNIIEALVMWETHLQPMWRFSNTSSTSQFGKFMRDHGRQNPHLHQKPPSLNCKRCVGTGERARDPLLRHQTHSSDIKDINGRHQSC